MMFSEIIFYLYADKKLTNTYFSMISMLLHTHTHTHTHTRARKVKHFSLTKYLRLSPYLLILPLFLCAVQPRVAAQVGILTDKPMGMFHVDPKGDTRIILPDTVGLADDVIVTTGGNLTIGSLPESVADTFSLLLTGGGTPSVPKSPLRIVDGNQQEGRVLTSYDTDGNAYWQNLPAGFSSGRVYGFQNVPAISFPYSTPTDIFTFQPDVPGSYLFEIRWWGKYKGQVAMPFMIFYLYRGSGVVDIFEQYSGINPDDSDNVCTLCLTLYGEALNTTDIFSIKLRVLSFYSSWQTNARQDTQTDPEWARTKVNVLRVD
jgi:hypothetical protein